MKQSKHVKKQLRKKLAKLYPEYKSEIRMGEWDKSPAMMIMIDNMMLLSIVSTKRV